MIFETVYVALVYLNKSSVDIVLSGFLKGLFFMQSEFTIVYMFVRHKVLKMGHKSYKRIIFVAKGITGPFKPKRFAFDRFLKRKWSDEWNHSYIKFILKTHMH